MYNSFHFQVNRFLSKVVCFMPKQADRELNRLCHHGGALSHAWHNSFICLLSILEYSTKLWQHWDRIEKVLCEGIGTSVQKVESS